MVSMAKKKTHKHGQGMVDISSKDTTRRTAVASAVLRMSKTAFNAFIKIGSPKGDVLETTKVAAVMAAKSTPNIIPLCHPLELGKVKVDFQIDKTRRAITVIVEVVYIGKTGVEMEALTAATAAALTIYDMMKWADKSMIITDVMLRYKSGGKSGIYDRKAL